MGPNARIDILVHGKRVGNRHMMRLDNSNPNSCCYTEDFFKKLRELANRPLYIHLWSCFGGSANKDAKALGDGSILVTHIEAKETSVSALIDDSLEVSLSRYFDKNLTPAQQCILDWQENYEAMTFNKVADAQLTQFKFIRIPKEKVMLDVIRTMQKEDDLIDCIKEFFTPEIARFKKTFKTEDITEASEEVSNINLQKAATLGHGILLHLSTNSKYIPPRLFSSFIDKLLDNGLNINNSFIDRTALHYATAKGNFAAVKLLLEKGADPTIPNKYGITPLDLAATGKNPNIVKLLMEAMMKLNNRNSIHYPLIQSGDKKGKEDKAPDILIEELRKLYIQNNTSRQKRKLEVIENSTAKRSKVEMQDSQVHPKSILENITLADIALQGEKYKMTLITDPAARVTPLVMNKKSKGVARGF